MALEGFTQGQLNAIQWQTWRAFVRASGFGYRWNEPYGTDKAELTEVDFDIHRGRLYIVAPNGVRRRVKS